MVLVTFRVKCSDWMDIWSEDYLLSTTLRRTCRDNGGSRRTTSSLLCRCRRSIASRPRSNLKEHGLTRDSNAGVAESDFWLKFDLRYYRFLANIQSPKLPTFNQNLISSRYYRFTEQIRRTAGF